MLCPLQRWRNQGSSKLGLSGSRAQRAGSALSFFCPCWRSPSQASLDSSPGLILEQMHENWARWCGKEHWFHMERWSRGELSLPGSVFSSPGKCPYMAFAHSVTVPSVLHIAGSPLISARILQSVQGGQIPYKQGSWVGGREHRQWAEREAESSGVRVLVLHLQLQPCVLSTVCGERFIPDGFWDLLSLTEVLECSGML